MLRTSRMMPEILSWRRPLQSFITAGASSCPRESCFSIGRRKDGSIPELSEGGGSLASLAAAMEDGSAESIEAPAETGQCVVLPWTLKQVGFVPLKTI